MQQFLAIAFAVLTTLTTLRYLWWQANNFVCWKKAIAGVPPDDVPAGELPAATIIIPARNEAANLVRLLTDILSQNNLTSTDEILLIDDDSTDATAGIARSFGPRVRYLRLADFLYGRSVVAHKKAALTYGISASTAPLIVTTDADCRWGPHVLSRIKQAAAGGNNFISGPVLIYPANNCLTGFQALDLAGYMLLTAAGAQSNRPLLANGAHLSFSRALFRKLDGYAGIDHLPSGDDVLLLQKAVKEPTARIAFLTDHRAVVTTSPALSWRQFWQQRIRWAGKTGSYTDPGLKYAQILAFAQSFFMLLLLAYGFIYPPFAWIALACWLAKALLEYRMLRHVSTYFGFPQWLRYYPFAALFQPFYLVLIGLTSLLGVKVRWKGRVAGE